MIAGSAIGAGEWLFGPAVTAQYGGTFLWLATFSIVFQVVYNLEVMRYALYCGEPIFIGFFRTRPGPRFWLLCYMTLFLAHIWPFMASNAAVPLASAVIGHLPGNGVVNVAGLSLSEIMLVKVLGYAVFFGDDHLLLEAYHCSWSTAIFRGDAARARFRMVNSGSNATI